MSESSHTQATAPGKLILSGEHAVVYGHPALVMAVNRYMTTTIEAAPSSGLIFSFPDFQVEREIVFPALMTLQKRIREDYSIFLEGRVSIREVLKEPIELVQFALSLLCEAVGLSSLPGMRIRMKTDLFIGCGMGSSAAVVLSVLVAVSHYLKITLSPELLFNLAHQAETMQHGKSSGLDLHSLLQGGCLYFKEGKHYVRTPSTLPFYLIHTGQPQTTTGECVSAAASYFKNTKIGDDFAAVTQAMDQALMCNQFEDVIYAIRENHQLLAALGVVPEKIQQLIAEIEKAGGAAKISGAGAVAGHQAGVLWVAMNDKAGLQKITERHHPAIIPIQCEPRGVYVHGS